MKSRSSNVLDNGHLYEQALYPTAPFSWLAPLWSFVCGVVASAAWSWTGDSALRLFLGVLLAGPLLGTVWTASARVRRQMVWQDCLSNEGGPKSTLVLPYTVAGSPGYRLATRLSFFATWWQREKLVLSNTVAQWIAGIVFSLAVAAQLGPRSLVVAALGLVAAHIVVFMRGWQILRSKLSISVPLCLAWLLGHVVFAPLNVASAVVAASFAFVFSGCFVTSATGRGLIAQVVPQAIVVASLIACSQPLAAVAVTLLASPQLLLAQLLEMPGRRERYFQAIQWHLALGMLLTALALGYRL